MAKLTAEQANELANNFLGLAQAIGDYRFSKWNDLSKSQNQQLGNLQWSILNSGEDMLALSTVLVMDDVQDALGKIDGITQQIGGVIAHLQKIQDVINVAASIVTLGAAIVSKNPQSIAGGIQGVLDSLNIQV